MPKSQAQLVTESLEFAVSSVFPRNQQTAAAARLRKEHVDALLDLASEIQTLLDQRLRDKARGFS